MVAVGGTCPSAFQLTADMPSTSLPQGLRVTAAGIRLSTWMVQKVDTLRWILAGIVNPDDDFDSTKRSVRSRATGICIFIIFYMPVLRTILTSHL